MSAQSGFRMLAAAGLSMQAALPVDSLPDWAKGPIQQAGAHPERYQTLILLGQGGSRLWELLEATAAHGDARFDDAARELAGRFVTDYLGGVDWVAVYPGPALMPLGRLAELAGWGRPSPLGLTINDAFGLWLAHRIAFLVDAPVPSMSPAEFEHPCDQCSDKPCVAACPVGAVDAQSGFDVDTCATFRIEEGSVCAYQCLARLACPVGAEHRYGPEQMEYHYGSGLESIRRYYGA